ncbi:unnamed protein product, partial [Ectocarpus sp. 13 AM-2016]
LLLSLRAVTKAVAAAVAAVCRRSRRDGAPLTPTFKAHFLLNQGFARKEPNRNSSTRRCFQNHVRSTISAFGTSLLVEQSSSENRSRGVAISPPLAEYHGTVYGTVQTILVVEQSSFEDRPRKVAISPRLTALVGVLLGSLSFLLTARP